MFFERIREGLAKTRQGFLGRIRGILRARRPLDDEVWEELEESLIGADLGVRATEEILQELEREARRRGIRDADGLYEVLREALLRALKPYEAPFRLKDHRKPTVVLALGVNGVGKTTTLAKIAHRFTSQGKRVMIAAADTFRAAAIEQLEIWADKAGAQVLKHRPGADPAAVAYDALSASRARGYDLLLIDTAGRLHTKGGLLEEMRKLKRVLERLDPEAPDETLLVLDATTGQNALFQAKAFHEALGITGIALVKLDGTAKGGIIVAIARELGIPLRFVGVGENLEDLADFSAEEFVEALLPRP